MSLIFRPRSMSHSINSLKQSIKILQVSSTKVQHHLLDFFYNFYGSSEYAQLFLNNCAWALRGQPCLSPRAYLPCHVPYGSAC